MQFQLFFDYAAIVNSCSFVQKYDAIFQSFDRVYDGPNHPAFGRKGYPKAAYLKALIYKQSSGGKKRQFAFYWGYRTHVLVSREGVVLVEVTKPNDVADKDVAKSLMRKLKRVYGQRKGRRIALDAAYDSNDVYNFIADEMKSEAFIAENPRYKKPVAEFDELGRPICEGGLAMKFCGAANEADRSRVKYRCPIRGGNKSEQAKLPAECPVAHPRFIEGKRYGCTAYIDLAGDARARARLRRQSRSFRETYDLRTEVERYFSRLGPREVEETTLYKYRSVRNQMSIAHLSLNLVAVAAAIVLQRPERIRCHKTFADALAA